ncbi:MAG: hypothetical protein ACYC18_13310 [Gammaproteobacteria bacterium]
MIITRYLVREIRKPLPATCLALVVICANRTTALFLQREHDERTQVLYAQQASPRRALRRTGAAARCASA